jgi:cytochrome c-type biogenesis protein CcmH
VRWLLAVVLLVTAAGFAHAQKPADDPMLVVGPPRGQPLTGEALEARTKEVASVLRCPVCQGLSVGDSPSPTAQNMKAHVKELLAQGYLEDQILAYFERSYGEFVRLEPARRGVNWLVWIAPVAALLLGVAVVAFKLRPPKVPESPPSPSVVVSGLSEGRDRLPEDPRLATHVLKARELAYGWKGGVSPRPESP